MSAFCGRSDTFPVRGQTPHCRQSEKDEQSAVPIRLVAGFLWLCARNSVLTGGLANSSSCVIQCCFLVWVCVSVYAFVCVCIYLPIECCCGHRIFPAMGLQVKILNKVWNLRWSIQIGSADFRMSCANINICEGCRLPCLLCRPSLCCCFVWWASSIIEMWRTSLSKWFELIREYRGCSC